MAHWCAGGTPMSPLRLGGRKHVVAAEDSGAARAPTGRTLLDVDDLATHFTTPRGTVKAVDGVSFPLDRGRTLGLVGESGCGKSVLSRSIMGLLPSRNVVRRGAISFDGHRLDQMGPAELRSYWGTQLAMVFQDPMTSLNPVMRIGKQITESLQFHFDMDRKDAKETALALLRSVNIPEPGRRKTPAPPRRGGGGGPPPPGARPRPHRRDRGHVRRPDRGAGPHQDLVRQDADAVHGGSGGVDPAARERQPHPAQRHRRPAARPHRPAPGLPVRRPLPLRPGPLPRGAAAAHRGRGSRPRLPLLVPGRHRRRAGGAGTQPRRPRAPSRAGRDGRREQGRGGRGLMAGSGTAHLRGGDDVLLRVEDLVVDFPAGPGRHVSAVSKVSIHVAEGETLGLVGESGCGKSTTARAVIQLPKPTAGKVRFDGHELTALDGERLRALRPQMQIVFQDPISSLNPRRRVGDIVGAPLKVWGRGTDEERRARVDEVLEAVGLDPDVARDRRPHQFSGGQCQRICIARALVLEPKLVICDEPVSALDVSVQAQILNLLEDLKARYGLTLIFITHDLAVVKNVSDRVAVMYLGKICEVAVPDRLYASPAHPYTAALLSSIPVPDPEAPAGPGELAAGDLPSPLSPPSGCRFRTRCPRAQDRCAAEEPQVREV